jgi:hypothetical protein
MLGCEMKYQFPENPASFFRRERFIQRSWFMQAKVIQDHPDQDGIWIKDIDQPFHTMRKIDLRMMFSNPNITFASQRLIKHIQILHTMAFVLIIIALFAARAAWISCASLFNQLFQPFIKTNLGVLGVIGTLILLKDVFHTNHIFRTGLRDTPHFLLPGLYLFFLSVRRWFHKRWYPLPAALPSFLPITAGSNANALQGPYYKQWQLTRLLPAHPVCVSALDVDLHSALSPNHLSQTICGCVQHMDG